MICRFCSTSNKYQKIPNLTHGLHLIAHCTILCEKDDQEAFAFVTNHPEFQLIGKQVSKVQRNNISHKKKNKSPFIVLNIHAEICTYYVAVLDRFVWETKADGQ